MSKAPDFRMREDKLSPELESLIKDYLFDEFSPEYIESSGLEFLKGVAVPFKASDMVASKEGGINPSHIVDNMAMVIGANTHFPYVKEYLQYMAVFFNEKLIHVFTSRGAAELMQQHFRTATAYYRAALMLDSTDKMGMFGYACALREWYLSLEGEDGVDELIETLKSESTEYFEWAIIEHPEFDASYYYLGFAYLNAALYSKAQFIWTRFTELADNPDGPEVKEIKERLEQLKDPVRIETGINKLTTGDLEGGLKILEPYTESEFKNWWPLHFYLANTYLELEHVDEAIEGFKKVLALNPSNYDACKALADIYEQRKDSENAAKYSKKAEIILKNQEE
ncbi:MAG: tetratricopeptide repeat protein [Firmicutes bacterium]|nr:tetratricopeptide repeat protein [Bacillota bacterium]